MVGFGSAGIGITNLLAQFIQDSGLTEEQARDHFYAIDRCGLITENGKEVRPEQPPYARKEQEVQGWKQPNGEITLLNVIRHAKPSVLIGVSGQAGAFTEQGASKSSHSQWLAENLCSGRGAPGAYRHPASVFEQDRGPRGWSHQLCRHGRVTYLKSSTHYFRADFFASLIASTNRTATVDSPC
jgi:Malic enzyme, NAD binding domain